MSAKEASLSFLTSIEFGNKSANDITTPQKSNGSHELRKSNSTSKKARLRHSDNGRKQLIKYNEEKKRYISFDLILVFFQIIILLALLTF